jgi:hypothetical protein
LEEPHGSNNSVACLELEQLHRTITTIASMWEVQTALLEKQFQGMRT